MRRWFITLVILLLIVLALKLQPVTVTVYVPAPALPAAQAVRTVPLAYRLTLNSPRACWSVWYDLPCIGIVQLGYSTLTTPICNENGDTCITMLKLLKHRIPVLFAVPVLVWLAFTFDAQLAAQTPVSICVIGDSSTDSYQAEDNRGGAYHAVSFAWYEQIVRNRDVSAGAWANYGDARRTDYANNASRTGATASYIGGWGNGTLSDLNLSGIIVNRIAAGECDVLVYSIGANDYAPYYEGGYGWVYNGVVTPTQRANAVIAALSTSFNAVHNAAPSIPVVIVHVPDLNNTPLAPVTTYPDAAKRALVTQSISQVNAWIDAVAASPGSNAVAVDILSMFTNGDIPLSGGYWSIVNPPMYFWSLNNNPALGGFLAAPDGHGGTLFECKIANLILRGANTMLFNDVPEFTDAECLQHAGLSSTPTNTPTDTATVAPTPTITMTPIPALTNTPTTVPTPDAPPYIIIHRPGVADTIYFLPPGYARVSGYCSAGNAYMGIKEPGATLRKYVCWNE